MLSDHTLFQEGGYLEVERDNAKSQDGQKQTLRCESVVLVKENC